MDNIIDATAKFEQKRTMDKIKDAKDDLVVFIDEVCHIPLKPYQRDLVKAISAHLESCPPPRLLNINTSAGKTKSMDVTTGGDNEDGN